MNVIRSPIIIDPTKWDTIEPTSTEGFDLWSFQRIGLITLIGIIISIVCYYFLSKRKKLHLKNMELRIDTYPKKRSPIPFPSSDIQWLKNSSYYRLFFWGKIFAVLTIILIILEFYLLITGAHFDLPFYLVYAIIITGAFAFSFLVFNRSMTPTHVGLDDIGIHIKYKAKNPRVWFFKYLGWEEIRSIDHSPVPGTNRLLFHTLDGKELYLSSISKELEIMIKEKFQRGKEKKKKEDEETTPIIFKKEEKQRDYSSLSWRRNDYRNKNLKLVLFVIIIQISLIPVAIWYMDNWKIEHPGIEPNPIDYMWFSFPVIFALMLFIVGFTIPAKIAISKDAVFIKKRKDVSDYKFEKIKAILLDIRGLRFWGHSDVVEEVDFITPTTALRIFEALEEYNVKRGVTINNFSGNSEIEWIRNKTYALYHRLFVIIISLAVLSFTVTIILWYLSYLSELATIFMIMSPCFIMVSLIPLWFPHKRAPKEVGFSREGLHCKYANNKIGKALLNWISWKDIIEIDFESSLSNYIQGDMMRAGKNKNYVQIQKNSGIRYLLGPIDDNIFERLKMKFAK
jgi:hypothetical protein